MNRKILFLFAFIFVALFSTHAKVTSAPSIFQQYMTEIFQNYRNINLSVQEKKYDVTDIHLARMEEYIRKVPAFIPETQKNGKRLDKEKFIKRLDSLEVVVAEMRTALASYDFKAADRMPMEIFNICVFCHEDMKLKQLFHTPKHATLFGEYMHEISKKFETAELFLEHDEPNVANDYLKITNFYLDLLEDVLPAKGLSGIIMDRDSFIKRIDEDKYSNISFQIDIKGNRPVDIKTLKNKFNTLCVACHEPERIN